MRNDLERVCWGCELRYPGEATGCPACGSVARVDPSTDGVLRRALAGVRPLRDALVWGPLIPIYAAAAVIGLWFSSLAAVETWHESGALAVVIGLLGILALFLATILVLGMAWVPWALSVVTIAWVKARWWQRSRTQIDVAPFLHPPVEPGWLRELRSWKLGQGSWTVKRIGIVALAWVGLQVFCELLSPGAVFRQHSIGSALALIAIFAIVQAFSLGLLVPSTAMMLRGLVHAVERLRRVGLALGERRTRAAYADLEHARAEISEGRDFVEGRAERLEEHVLVAPLSGEPCLAFRLCGRAGKFRIDDGAAVPFAIEEDEETVALRAERFVVALPEPRATAVKLDEQRLARLRVLFEARGLPPPDSEAAQPLELAESVLCEGDPAIACGAPSSETADSADYRHHVRRRVLADTDGRPLLIERAR